jgi:hypothetical protein
MLDDLDSDGLLDVVVWGMMENNNCLQPYIQTKSAQFRSWASFNHASYLQSFCDILWDK